jgi:molybdenum cofactor cytidylyltransferase
MRADLAGLPLRTIDNPAWPSGMGTSIRAGLAAVLANSSPPAILIMLCDQPAVTTELLNQLIDRHTSDPALIVACEYDRIAGVPALFDASLFTELQNLPDSAGARLLIQRHANQVARIPFPQGSSDIDTPQDYDRLR